jgi:glc operon protein GlcG
LERLDNTFSAAAQISIGKARTAAIFKKPTGDFEKIIREGRTPMIALKDFTPLQGGVPIVFGGEVVGAVGVSGAASAQQDEEFAQAAAKALAAPGKSGGNPHPNPEVTYLDSQKVAAAFAKGAPLLETPMYKVHASRREKPGEAEIHTRETDVIYVLEGTSTFVTGGSVPDVREISPGELRGKEIKGGDSHRLKKGDVIVVPHGVPHWFKEVKAPFLYFVVKPIVPEKEAK